MRRRPSLVNSSLFGTGFAMSVSFTAHHFSLAVFFFLGTLPPALRASDSPMAIACFLLLTFFPDRPLFSVPLLRLCIARFTLRWALVLLVAMMYAASD
jgi:hypothetical protein